MRGLALFVAGTVVGASAIATAQSLSPNHGVVGLTHVGLSVPDIDKTVDYYTKTLGFPEAFRLPNASGGLEFVMVQVSKNTFIELQPTTPQRPAGISHLAIQVENMPAVTAMFKQRGAKVGDITVTGNGTNIADLTDLNGTRVELIELPPQSPLGRAMERWH